MGEWTSDKVGSPEYNLVDPALRDTTTVLFNGTTDDKAAWVALRCVSRCRKGIVKALLLCPHVQAATWQLSATHSVCEHFYITCSSPARTSQGAA